MANTPNDVVCRGSFRLGTACGACRKCCDTLKHTIERIDYSLRVDAAEYVPAIRGVFEIIDDMGLRDPNP